MSKLLVSIIVPVYNSKMYLSRCIDSLLCQSYQPIEIILVDDGSVDGSSDICDKYKINNSIIKVCHILNGGASRARKKGLSLCLGQYVTFVDSDDWVEPDYVETLVTILQKQNAKIAACAAIKHRENEFFKITKRGRVLLLNEIELHERFFQYEFWGFWGKVYVRSIFDDIYFPDATINEDYVVMAQLFYKCKSMTYIDAPLYHYMLHEEGLSKQNLSIRMMDEWINKLWCYFFYKKNVPKWEKYAEAQVAETCCKLISIIGNVGEFQVQKKEMQMFLKRHFVSLIFNRHFLWKLKFISLYHVIM